MRGIDNCLGRKDLVWHKEMRYCNAQMLQPIRSKPRLREEDCRVREARSLQCRASLSYLSSSRGNLFSGWLQRQLFQCQVSYESSNQGVETSPKSLPTSSALWKNVLFGSTTEMLR
jgi:hypothetical protein